VEDVVKLREVDFQAFVERIEGVRDGLVVPRGFAMVKEDGDDEPLGLVAKRALEHSAGDVVQDLEGRFVVDVAFVLKEEAKVDTGPVFAVDFEDHVREVLLELFVNIRLCVLL